jgi:phenylacetate-CoA ligase
MSVAAPGASATLARFQRLSRAELDALQLARLRRQLARVHARSAFYRERLDAAGVRPDGIRSLAEFSQRVPACTKADFLADQTAHPPFGTRLSVEPSHVALVNMTGGTSGQGQETYGRTQHDVALQGFLHALPWFIAGLRPGDVAFNCVPQGGLTTGGWGPPEGFRVAGATGVNIPGTLGTEAKLDLMLRFPDAAFVYASTNFLHTLTEAIRRRGMRPGDAFRSMRGLFVAGEGYPRRWAESIVRDWGCALHEGYGSTQGAGFVASTCAAGAIRSDGAAACLHCFEWENLVEVVDPATGLAVAPGEEGEIVLTNLGIQGSPVIRFATGDRARRLPAQACGCGLAWTCLEAGTIARYDDMLKIRGNNLWPATVDAILFAEPAVAEYAARVYVDDAGRTEVELRYALKADARAAIDRDRLCAALAAAIKDRTNVSMRLREVPREELPTFEYKARRWTDERRAGYAAQASKTGSGS